MEGLSYKSVADGKEPHPTSQNRRRRRRSRSKKVWVVKSREGVVGKASGAAEAPSTEAVVSGKVSEAVVSKNVRADKEEIPKASDVSTQNEQKVESQPTLACGKEVVLKKRPASSFLKLMLKKIISRDEAFLTKPANIAALGEHHEVIREALFQYGYSDALNRKWVEYVCKQYGLLATVIKDRDFVKGEMPAHLTEAVSSCIRIIPKGMV